MTACRKRTNQEVKQPAALERKKKRKRQQKEKREREREAT
jgi:hypothetical protein